MNILNKVTHVFLNLIFIIGWIGFVGFVVFELIFFVPALFQSMNVEVLYWLWLACFIAICFYYPLLFRDYYKKFFAVKVLVREKTIIIIKCLWLAILMIMSRSFLLLT
ncbi:MAG: hypothetical protein IJX20_00385 [Alphaproteobacteria bacterium]|nr:hypothetical protein [Alphaproteobacteria bacterium]